MIDEGRSAAPPGVPRRLTQKGRVLRMLRHAAGTGITQLECDAPVDGGAPIRRLASRVAELRRDGHQIETLPARRRKMAVYVLRGTES